MNSNRRQLLKGAGVIAASGGMVALFQNCGVSFSAKSGQIGASSTGGPISAALSVKEFGAIGDGTVDDTAAIQACIDASHGAPVFLPPGKFRITKTLYYDASKALGVIDSSQKPGLRF